MIVKAAARIFAFVIGAVALANCSPYHVYREEVSALSGGISDLSAAYRAAYRNADSDRNALQTVAWVDSRARIRMTCSGTAGGGAGGTAACIEHEVGRSAPARSLTEIQAERGLEIIRALQNYSEAIASITSASDREAYDAAAAELTQALPGLESAARKIDSGFPPLAAPADLFLQGAGAFLDFMRYRALRAAVLSADPAVTVLGSDLGEALSALRMARESSLTQATNRLYNGLGPELGSGYALRLEQARASRITLNAVRSADPAGAVSDMIEAHHRLATAVQDNSRQIASVTAAVRAFVAKARALREALQAR